MFRFVVDVFRKSRSAFLLFEFSTDSGTFFSGNTIATFLLLPGKHNTTMSWRLYFSTVTSSLLSSFKLMVFT